MPQSLARLNALILDLQARAQWLPNWALVALVVILFGLIGWAGHAVIFALLRRLVRKRDLFWRGVVERGRAKLRVLVLIIATGVAVTVSPLDAETAERIRSLLLIAFILTLGWLASGVLNMWTLVYMRRFNIEAEDNLVARKHVTQTRILQRVARVLIVMVTVALAMMPTTPADASRLTPYSRTGSNVIRTPAVVNTMISVSSTRSSTRTCVVCLRAIKLSSASIWKRRR